MSAWQGDFLSCLYGSARASSDGQLTAAFLSCLYGSAPVINPVRDLRTFLSCLYGSAQRRFGEHRRHRFLSCLYGSAPLHISANQLIDGGKSKSPFKKPFLKRLKI